MNEEPLDLEILANKIKKKADKLEKEINEGWKIERSVFYIELPAPERFVECKKKDWEVARLYGMLYIIKLIKKRFPDMVNKNG